MYFNALFCVMEIPNALRFEFRMTKTASPANQPAGYLNSHKNRPDTRLIQKAIWKTDSSHKSLTFKHDKVGKISSFFSKVAFLSLSLFYLIYYFEARLTSPRCGSVSLMEKYKNKREKCVVIMSAFCWKENAICHTFLFICRGWRNRCWYKSSAVTKHSTAIHPTFLSAFYIYARRLTF